MWDANHMSVQVPFVPERSRTDLLRGVVKFLSPIYNDLNCQQQHQPAVQQKHKPAAATAEPEAVQLVQQQHQQHAVQAAATVTRNLCSSLSTCNSSSLL
jgi:hypothetical protein